jgi:hypothetical protein
MSARFVTIDREAPLLFPEDLRKRAPEDHIVHFIIEAVGKLDIRNFAEDADSVPLKAKLGP